MIAIAEQIDDYPSFAAEIRTYAKHHETLLEQHRGKFALVVGDNIEGVFPTMLSAAEAAALRFGFRSVFIQEISDTPPVDVQPSNFAVNEN